MPFDLAVIVPLHGGAGYVGRSPGLGDELDFIPVDPHTLQAKVKPNVFALGDATDVPASKAGSVAHFEGEVLAGNVRRFLAGEPLAASFDGHTNCFIETGGGRALLIDFNYDTEPLTRALPRPVRPAAAAAVPPEPPRQAGLPAAVLARPAPRPRHPRHRPGHAGPGQEPL